MSLTRKYLKAMGIEDEKIEQIIEAHGETVTALKTERDEFKAQAETAARLQEKLTEAEERLSKAGTGDVVAKADFDKMKQEFDDYKSEISAKEKRAAKEHAFRALLTEAGVSEKRIGSIVKVTNLDEIKLDENGKIADEKNKLEQIKTEWSDFIPSTQTRGANTATPPNNNGGQTVTRERIMAIRDGTERRKAMAANPELFNLSDN